MAFIHLDKDWPGALSTWDAERLARHGAHAGRFVEAGWRTETASIIAYDLVIEEDEATKARVLGRLADTRHADAKALLGRIAAGELGPIDAGLAGRRA